MKIIGVNWAELTNVAAHRRAHVFEISTRFDTYRVRFEDLSPDAVLNREWWGGLILDGHDKPTLEEAIALAEEWVEDGRLPERA
ncbi:hypothetical protein ACQSSU_20395 [Micromonospora echinospora]